MFGEKLNTALNNKFSLDRVTESPMVVPAITFEPVTVQGVHRLKAFQWCATSSGTLRAATVGEGNTVYVGTEASSNVLDACSFVAEEWAARLSS